jgi:hypothetical protein
MMVGVEAVVTTEAMVVEVEEVEAVVTMETTAPKDNAVHLFRIKNVLFDPS